MNVTDPILFTASVLLILMTPGPTNTLLAASGALRGVRRSLPLLIAELAGYLSCITVVGLLWARWFSHAPGTAQILRGVSGAYLLFVAVRTFRARQDAGAAAVTFRRVFVTTLLNPKGLVLALVIIPMSSPNAAAYVLGFAMILPIVGGAWIVTGCMLGRAAGRAGISVIPKITAFALACFSTVLIVSTLIG